MKCYYEHPEMEVLIFTLEENFLASGGTTGTGSGKNLDDPETINYDDYFGQGKRRLD